MDSTWLVEVLRRDPAADPAGARLLRAAREGGVALREVRLASLYELGPATREEAERLALELLADPLLDRVRVVPAHELAPTSDRGQGEDLVTVLRREGVMDPVALSLVGAARELGVPLTHARTARRVYCGGQAGVPERPALEALARGLSNPVVDRVIVGPGPLPAPAGGAAAATGPLRTEVPLSRLTGEALVALSRARTLALDAEEMAAIQAHYAELGREPTELELETLAQTWSEHCKHKTLTGPIELEERLATGEVRRRRWENLLRQTIFAATEALTAPAASEEGGPPAVDHCLSVFADNAGVIRFDQRHGVAVKVETHNHPSAIEPYGGAGTGVGGVIRDILGTGLGARPLLNLDVFCVGDLQAAPESLPAGTIHPRALLEGVVAGVRDYGNRMGIPTLCGGLVSEPRYAGNPLVYCGTVGLIPVERVDKAARPGDVVITVGGRIGRDGIHGATFSSDALSGQSEAVSGGAVQIGHPLCEKMVADVLLEVRDRGLLRAVTDCGAGGLSSAVGEMAEGVGARVDLSRAPLKYSGLQPWEVWVSEAQERMVLAVAPEHVDEVVRAFAAEDVEATVLGTFTGDQRLVVTWGQTVVGDLSLDFLHHGLPRQVRRATFTHPPRRPLSWPGQLDLGQLLLRVLAAPSVCSKEWIVRQYDHEVQGATALKPFVGVHAAGPSDAVAVAPLPGSPRGVVCALGLNPRHGAADPWDAAAGAVDEALRNLVCVGGDPRTAGILDNFSWGDCRDPARLGELVRAAEACQAAALAYRVPFISGKDSLNNEWALPDGSRVAIPGTLLITAVGVVEDVGRLVSMDLKQPGDLLLLVGETGGPSDGLLGSHAAELLGLAGGAPPQVDLARAPRLLEGVRRAIATGAVRAAHDLSEGGLAVAAAEMALAGGVGAALDLRAMSVPSEWPDATLLFGEAPTRFLLEVAPARRAEVVAALGADAPWVEVGTTAAASGGAPTLRVTGRSGQLVLELPLERLERSWRGTLPCIYEGTEEGP